MGMYGLKRGPKDNSKRKGIPAQRKAKRRAEALKRDEIYRELTTSQKMELIAGRPGNNQREINRLAKLKDD